MNYKDLEIWKLARELVIDIHKMSLGLPKIEARRRYNADFIKFLVYAHASNDETIDHLETLFETGSLTDEQLYNTLKQKLDLLGRKLNKFISAVETEHISPK